MTTNYSLVFLHSLTKLGTLQFQGPCWKVLQRYRYHYLLAQFVTNPLVYNRYLICKTLQNIGFRTTYNSEPLNTTHTGVFYFMEIYGHDHAMSVKANEIYRINSTYFFIPEYCQSNHVGPNHSSNVLLRLNLRIFYISFHFLAKLAR